MKIQSLRKVSQTEHIFESCWVLIRTIISGGCSLHKYFFNSGAWYRRGAWWWPAPSRTSCGSRSTQRWRFTRRYISLLLLLPPDIWLVTCLCMLVSDWAHACVYLYLIGHLLLCTDVWLVTCLFVLMSVRRLSSDSWLCTDVWLVRCWCWSLRVASRWPPAVRPLSSDSWLCTVLMSDWSGAGAGVWGRQAGDRQQWGVSLLPHQGQERSEFHLHLAPAAGGLHLTSGGIKKYYQRQNRGFNPFFIHQKLTDIYIIRVVLQPWKNCTYMLSEGNAAHPVECDSPLQILMSVWHPFLCLNSNFLGQVWQLTIMVHHKATTICRGLSHLTRSLSSIVCRGR